MKIKRIIYLLLVLCIGIITLSLLNNDVYAIKATEDDEIYHILTTVTEDPSSSMMVNYHSKQAGSYVLYTKKYDTNFKEAIKVVPEEEEWSTEGMKNASSTKSNFARKRFVCNALLTGLDARTAYIYKIVSGNFESAVNSFTTSGLTNTWNFAAFTDFQYRNNTITHKLIKNMKEIGSNPALMLCSGDLTDVADNEFEYTHIFDNEEFSNFVFASSPGDHEYWGEEDAGHPQWDFPYTFVKLFHFPDNGSETSKGTTYYFIYNNVLFVSLDMNNSDTSTGTRIQHQVSWFKSTMNALKDKYQYVVVFMHKSIFGSAKEDSSVSKNLRPLWYPIFQEYNVDLVLSGHDHMYSRTYQLNGNKKSLNPLVGTYYLDMGSSGDKYRSPDETVVQGDSFHEKVIDLKTKNYSCSSNIEVSDKEMKVTVYNQNKVVIDEFTIKAKREAPSVSAEGFSQDKFLQAVELKALNLESKIARLKVLPNEAGKYVTNIKVLDGDKELLNKKYNNSGDEEFLVRDFDKQSCKIEITLIDGTKQVFDKTLDICSDDDIRVDYNPFKIYLKNDTIKNYIKSNNYKYELKVDGEKLSEKQAFTDDIILDNKYYEQDHNIEVLLYTEAGAYIGSYHLESKKLNDIVLPETEINMELDYVLLFDLRYKYMDLIECESDIVEFNKETSSIKALREGTGEVTFRVKGTNIKTTIPVTITNSKANVQKSGCNKGAAMIETLNALAIAAYFFLRRKTHA